MHHIVVGGVFKLFYGPAGEDGWSDHRTIRTRLEYFMLIVWTASVLARAEITNPNNNS